MRKFTTEHTVYTFDELSEEAQAKAIEAQREFEYDTLDSWLPDEMDYKLGELLREYGLVCESPKVWYSLGYSQGDGAMFEGTVDYKQFEINIKQRGNYYHYNSKSFDIDLKNGNNISMAVHEKIEQEFDEIYVDICKKLERAGYNAIESATDDEALIRNIKDNEYEFYSDGKQA